MGKAKLSWARNSFFTTLARSGPWGPKGGSELRLQFRTKKVILANLGRSTTQGCPLVLGCRTFFCLPPWDRQGNPKTRSIFMALLEVSWKLFWWWRRRRRRRSWQPLRPRERQLAFGGHDMNPSFDFPQTNKSSHDFLPFPAGDGIVFCLAKPNIAQQPRETYSECHRLIYKIFAAYRAKRSVTLFADFLKEFAFAISPAYLKSGDNPQFSVRMQSELSLKH